MRQYGRRLRFAPSKREEAMSFNATESFIARAHDKQPEHQRVIKPIRERRPPGVDIDAIHRKQPPPLEGELLRAVSELLEQHPRVLFAIRQNTGAASYEAKTGRYAPIFFYKWIRWPCPMTLPDVWGMLTNGAPFFFELKRPGWTKPTDERERKQAAFLGMVREAGHIGAFITDAEQVSEALK